MHGQTIWIDPAADMVIVRLASNPVAGNAASDPISLPAYRAVAEHLMASDKSPLTGREWTVVSIAGAGVIDHSPATLQFLPGGRLAGNASCNRIIGSFRLAGTQLSLQPAGTTMMACPEALMNQERKLLGLLPRVESYRIDNTGALILRATDGSTIVARR